MAVTSTVAAGLLVPLVLSGELRGALFDGSCDEPGALARLPDLPGVVPPNPRPIVLGTGDLLGPEPLSGYAFEGPDSVKARLLRVFRSQGRPVFDAVLPGNFELAADPARTELLGADDLVPWTVANVPFAKSSRRHRVFVRNGIRIGVTAVVDTAIEGSLSAGAKVEISSPEKALDEATAALFRAGVDIVVALVHVRRSDGFDRVAAILEGMKGRKPQVVLTSPLVSDPAHIRLDRLGVTIVTSPRDPAEAAVVELELGPRRALRRVRSQRRRVPPVPSAQADIIRNWVCGHLDIPIQKGGERPIERKDFIRMLLEQMRRQTGSEVALVNLGSIGPESVFPLPAAPTRLDVRRALPFHDRLRVLELKGAVLGPIETLVADPRIASVGLKEGKVAGRVKDTNRTYRVVTIDYVAEGREAFVDPAVLAFAPAADEITLREMVLGALETKGFESAVRSAEPTLLDFKVDVGANLKSVNVQNRTEAEAPQLTRNNFFGLSGDLAIRFSVDLPSHRLELAERTRFGIVTEDLEDGGSETRENEDVTVVELTYAGRLARGLDEPWIPDAGATARLETELTVPTDERGYRRALLQAGVGPAWQLASNLSFRSQLGFRRELLASSSSSDADEAALAETRVALLSTLELRDDVIVIAEGRPVKLNLRVDHTADLTGEVRDQVFQGHLGLDVPIIGTIALTAALDVYVLAREQLNGPNGSGGALDTSLGVKSALDMSEVFY